MSVLKTACIDCNTQHSLTSLWALARGVSVTCRHCGTNQRAVGQIDWLAQSRSRLFVLTLVGVVLGSIGNELIALAVIFAITCYAFASYVKTKLSRLTRSTG
jgi:hypothetical protein